jgi:hypothetical protein
MERLDTKAHIVESFKLAYKAVALENPEEARTRFQPAVREALSALGYVRNHIGYLMYPLLLKMISDSWLSYKDLFILCRDRFLWFIRASAEDQIDPERIIVESAVAAAQAQTEDRNFQNENVTDSQPREVPVEPESYNI